MTKASYKRDRTFREPMRTAPVQISLRYPLLYTFIFDITAFLDAQTSPSLPSDMFYLDEFMNEGQSLTDYVV